ncbi:hypothetical protein Tco_0642373 [Tanacetum coccineum]
MDRMYSDRMFQIIHDRLHLKHGSADDRSTMNIVWLPIVLAMWLETVAVGALNAALLEPGLAFPTSVTELPITAILAPRVVYKSTPFWQHVINKLRIQLHSGHGHLDVTHVVDEFGKRDIVIMNSPALLCADEVF